jgi:hypothetical protein
MIDGKATPATVAASAGDRKCTLTDTGRPP